MEKKEAADNGNSANLDLVSVRVDAAKDCGEALAAILKREGLESSALREHHELDGVWRFYFKGNAKLFRSRHGLLGFEGIPELNPPVEPAVARDVLLKQNDDLQAQRTKADAERILGVKALDPDKAVAAEARMAAINQLRGLVERGLLDWRIYDQKTVEYKHYTRRKAIIEYLSSNPPDCANCKTAEFMRIVPGPPAHFPSSFLGGMTAAGKVRWSMSFDCARCDSRNAVFPDEKRQYGDRSPDERFPVKLEELKKAEAPSDSQKEAKVKRKP